MICDVYKVEAERSNFGAYCFSFVDGRLGYWIDESGPITLVSKKGVKP